MQSKSAFPAQGGDRLQIIQGQDAAAGNIAGLLENHQLRTRHVNIFRPNRGGDRVDGDDSPVTGYRDGLDSPQTGRSGALEIVGMTQGLEDNLVSGATMSSYGDRIAHGA